MEALSMPSVCHGAPNLYFLFATMSLFNLKEHGEMVYIIPRSWTSGAYFTAFRKYLLKEGALRHVHLFVSRDDIFENEDVLQETIIIKLEKSNIKDFVKITSTKSSKDFNNIKTFIAPYNVIVNGAEQYVYLVTTEEHLKMLRKFERWKNTLPSIGLRMRTGLTVDFRCREFLRNSPCEGVVPLLYAQHIQDGIVVHPIGKKDEYIITERRSLIQKNTNYLLVKRFTSKEEKRRLQCGIYLASTQQDYDFISTDNKVNYIEGVQKDLSIEQVYGLYALFNSTIYDHFYRILNGSTQVNSTEINSMPVPALEQIEQLGRNLIKANDLSVGTCDRLVELINE